MRKERAGLRQEIAAGRAQFLLPFEGGDNTKMLENKDGPRLLTSDEVKVEKSKQEMEMRFGKDTSKDKDSKDFKSGLDKMEEFVSENFVDETISDHLKQMEKRRRLKVYEIPEVTRNEKSSVSSSYDSLLDGAVPSHFMDDV